VFKVGHSLFRLLVPTLTLTTALAFTQPGCAQAPPPPGMDTTGAPDLNEQQRKQLTDFANYWTSVMSNSASKPEDVEEARDTLLEPLQKFNAAISPNFRINYALSLVPDLQKVIAGQNIHAVVNAIIVASQLGHDKAVNLLLPLCDSRYEQRWQVRLQAAYGCKTLLGSKLLDFRKVKDAAGKLREASNIEENGLILGHHLAAIDAGDQTNLQPQDRRQIRQILVDAIVAAIARIEKMPNNPHPSPLLEPVTMAVLSLRNKFTSPAVEPSERKEIAGKLAPSLGKMLAIAGKNWDTCRQDPQAMKLCTAVIATCEGFLPLLAAEVASPGEVPQTKLKDAWVGDNREKFDAELRLWQTALDAPHFSK
jgi:hypothetical protein